MNDETYGALKRIVEEVEQKRKADCDMRYCIVNEQIGGNDIYLVQSWIDETAKEHPQEDTPDSCDMPDCGYDKPHRLNIHE